MEQATSQKSVNGRYAPQQKADNLAGIRDVALNSVLLFFTLIGTIIWIVNLIGDFPSQNWNKIIVYTLPYLGLVILTIFRKLPYLVRSIGLLVILFGIGVGVTLIGPMPAISLIWYMGLTVLCAVLINLPAGILAFILSWITYLVLGWLMINQVLEFPFSISWQGTVALVDWIIYGLVYAVVTVSLVIGISVSINQLNRKLEKESRVIVDLESEMTEVGKRVSDVLQQIEQERKAQEISHAITTGFDSDMLRQQTVNVVRDHYHLACVDIYLLDGQTDELILDARSGEAAQSGISRGHRLPVNSNSTVSWSVTHRLPRIGSLSDERRMRIDQPQAAGANCQMVLPLSSNDQIFGVLTLQANRQQAFREEDIPRYQVIADALATSLHKLQLSQREQESLEELHTLNRQYLSDAREKTNSGYKGSSYTYTSEKNSELAEEGPFVNLPIKFGEQVIGVIGLELPQTRLTEDDRDFIEQVTNQAALAMENIRLVEVTARRASHDRLVAEIVKKARASADVDEILRTTLGELGWSMQASEGVIRLEIPKHSEMTQSGGGEV